MVAGGVKVDWVIANASSMTAIRVMRRNVTANSAFVAATTLGGSGMSQTTYTDALGSGGASSFVQGNVYEYKVEVDAA